ncbi:MAG: hypothetical protein H6751_14755 [Candidatus Omnitrophica bacterium]|nr:hypothetical protein [Candidatus Omnitrophota bacterium]
MLQHNPRALGENPFRLNLLRTTSKPFTKSKRRQDGSTPASLAELLSVSAPSVTAMVKRLSQEDPPCQS